MQKAIDETNRRREIQLAHNKKFGIIPQTIKKPIENNLLSLVASYRDFEDIVAEEMVDLGIDKKDLPHIFKRFYKGKSNSKEDSVGIGLAMAKSIIESQNGDIYVKSEKNKGTEFHIVIHKTYSD